MFCRFNEYLIWQRLQTNFYYRNTILSERNLFTKCWQNWHFYLFSHLRLFVWHLVEHCKFAFRHEHLSVLHIEAQLQMDFSKGVSPQTFLLFWQAWIWHFEITSNTSSLVTTEHSVFKHINTSFSPIVVFLKITFSQFLNLAPPGAFFRLPFRFKHIKVKWWKLYEHPFG